MKRVLFQSSVEQAPAAHEVTIAIPYVSVQCNLISILSTILHINV